jgi:hypothetical protein
MNAGVVEDVRNIDKIAFIGLKNFGFAETVV